MAELCKTCKTPMEVAKNRNGGYFATCPNKSKHSGKPVSAAAVDTPADLPAVLPPAAVRTEKTLWW